MKENNTFVNEGYVEIEYQQDLRKSVIVMQDAWKAFCSLPEEERLKFPYSSEDAGVGYELKKEIGDTLDLKENFNFTLGKYEWLLQAAKSTGLQESINLVESCQRVYFNLRPEIISFAKRMEDEALIPNLERETRNSEESYYIRLIHYFGDSEVGDEIASPHIDKSGFTFHLYEDTPGLQRLSHDMKWVNMNVTDGMTQVIPNVQLQYLTKGEVKATFHRVVATKKSSSHGRYSAVCFVMLKDVPKYNKAGKGRLQDTTAGFNYSISHQDFSKLLK